MSNKSSLANKKRKKIKFDATSGSITGFLLSSSESIDINNLSDRQATLETPPPASQFVNRSLSNEFDDSFDLFAAKRTASKKAYKDLRQNNLAPCKKSNKTSPLKNSASPHKNSKSTAKTITVKKCDYFVKTAAPVVPCPFCFKYEEDMYAHISSNCIRPSCINDNIAAELIELHTEYWDKRRTLGIPDLTFNEDEVFKTVGSQGQKSRDSNNENSSECKFPVLKWNSKSKKSKYLLLRQNQTERVSKITQKLAIVLMDCEAAENSKRDEDQSFQTVDKSITSDVLSNLLGKELTFWQKSSIEPSEITEDMYYIKALAPFIAPREKKTSIVPSPVPIKNEDHDADRVDLFSGANNSQENVDSVNSPHVELSADQESQTKDSSVAETELFESSPTNSKYKGKSFFETHLTKNWEKMYNTSDLSDMTISFSDGNFLGHSLVFYTHSIKIFRSISSSSDEESGKLLDWKAISSAVGRAFIRFIYSGRVDHFSAMNCSELESVKSLCDKYDEISLETFITQLINSKKSLEISKNLSIQNRNLTSPDIFENIDSIDGPTNGISSLLTNSYSVDSSISSKRKLEISMDLENEYNKRFKTESPLNTVEVIEEPLDIGGKISEVKSEICSSKNEVISVSDEDKISVCSSATVSPSRYEDMVKCPLSQCSTLPPLPESPCKDDHLDSLSPHSLVQDYLEDQNSPAADDRSSHKNFDEGLENLDYDVKTPENNLYYDPDSFDYNNYVNSNWGENVRGVKKSDLNEPKTTAAPSAKNSLDKYFEDSLPPYILEASDFSKTPKSDVKSNRGSPIYKSTPTQLIVSTKNLTTPSPQILVSDKVTPRLNYSSLVSPELKSELRKYGLKPNMDRKKAKILLSHIYESIHPVISQAHKKKSIGQVSAVDTEENTSLCLQNDTSHEINGFDNITNREIDEGKIDTSAESLLAHEKEFKEDQEFDFELLQEDIQCSQTISSYLPKNKLLHSVSEFIKQDPVLFVSILQYVPIWLKKFHQALKESGIKCTLVDLMDVLDELCITYRTEKKVKEKSRSKR